MQRGGHGSPVRGTARSPWTARAGLRKEGEGKDETRKVCVSGEGVCGTNWLGQCRPWEALWAFILNKRKSSKGLEQRLTL